MFLILHQREREVEGWEQDRESHRIEEENYTSSEPISEIAVTHGPTNTPFLISRISEAVKTGA